MKVLFVRIFGIAMVKTVLVSPTQEEWSKQNKSEKFGAGNHKTLLMT
jgi:hypothetical protein